MTTVFVVQVLCGAFFLTQNTAESDVKKAAYALQVNMREAECARTNLAEDLSRLRMELEKVRVFDADVPCMLDGVLWVVVWQASFMLKTLALWSKKC